MFLIYHLNIWGRASKIVLCFVLFWTVVQDPLVGFKIDLVSMSQFFDKLEQSRKLE